MTHIQQPTEPMSEAKGHYVTVQQRKFIKSTTPILTRSQVATILGISTIQVDRRTKAGMLKRVDIPGVVGYDMFDNRLDRYVQLIDDLGDPIE